MSLGGGMLSFRIRGGYKAASSFLESLRIFALAESLGGVESLAEHPARMTHSSLPIEERARMGITDDLIRLSVGVEDAQDLIQDVQQALDSAFA
jgi:cystathionine gamma-lyase